MLDADGFMAWLKKGPERAPLLYGGKLEHRVDEAVPTQVKAVSGAIAPLGEHMFKERVEFDRKQATADHNDGDDWDGYEGTEEGA